MHERMGRSQWSSTRTPARSVWSLNSVSSGLLAAMWTSVTSFYVLKTTLAPACNNRFLKKKTNQTWIYTYRHRLFVYVCVLHRLKSINDDNSWNVNTTHHRNAILLPTTGCRCRITNAVGTFYFVNVIRHK